MRINSILISLGLLSSPLNAPATPRHIPPKVGHALTELRRGSFVYLYDGDGREEETDLVVASQHVTAHHIAALRSQAGGLICTTLDPRHHQALGLPYLIDVLRGATAEHPILARLTDAVVPYEGRGSKPSFGLTINHRETFTGVTDADRALTISRLAALLETPAQGLPDRFAAQFKAPGHVNLLNAHPDLLAARRGHTELSTVLVAMAGLVPSATICEIMGGPQGAALPKEEARRRAEAAGAVFLEGRDVLDAWERTR